MISCKNKIFSNKMTKLAKYEQHHQLTESGAFSVRYKGLWDKKIPVVLKKPDLNKQQNIPEKKLLSLWQCEIKNHTGLDHPNIVRVIESEFVPGELSACFLLMVWCNAGDLLSALDNAQKGRLELPLSTRYSIMNDMAQAIEYLHQKMMIHRDIKPENILLHDNNGKITAQLTDLGFSEQILPDADGFWDVDFVGTPPYVAPEINDTCYYSVASDIFALGAVYYSIVTLTMPEVLIPLPETVPVELNLLITNCMSDDLKKRPRISEILACSFFKYESDEPVPSPGWCCIFNR